MAVVTSENSPDSLPIKNYSIEQLKAYIKRQLGAPTWTLEITDQHVIDGIKDALMLHNQWRPKYAFKTIHLTSGVTAYLSGEDIGDGIIDVTFVEPYPTPTEIFYGNLIDPAPILRSGLDEYDTWMRWQKMWKRVMSVLPDWYYDDSQKVLYIHNPISRYQCTVFYAKTVSRTEDLDAFGARWVKEYALQRAKYTYGEILSKFSGAIPGPVKDLQLDQAKREQAQARIDTLEEQLRGAQTSSPLSID